MLGRKPNGGLKPTAKKRKWQESEDDGSVDENITKEDMEKWRANMQEEEKQEQVRREQQERRDREAAVEARRREKLEAEARRRKEEEEAEAARLASQAAAATAELERQRQATAQAVGAAAFTAGGATASTSAAAVAAPAPAVQQQPWTMVPLTIQAAQVAHPGPPGPGGPGTQDIATVTFQIPTAKVCDVLGVRGMNIRAVKQQSGVHKITILDRAEPATVQVTGTPAHIERARALVMTIVSGDQSCVGNATAVVPIEDSMVPRIIGPKGQTMKQMKDQSGAYIAVRKNPEGMQQQVEITGPPDAVSVARQLVLRFLMEQSVAAVACAAGAQPLQGMATVDIQSALPSLQPPGLTGMRPLTTNGLLQSGMVQITPHTLPLHALDSACGNIVLPWLSSGQGVVLDGGV